MPAVPADFVWAGAKPILAPAAPVSYQLKAGTFADEQATIDVEVPMAGNDAELRAARGPVFAISANGLVAYVAEDGQRSEVHLTSAHDPDDDEIVGELTSIVRSIALSNDGRYAYLMAGQHGGSGDAAVLRLSLDGRGELLQVMAPAMPQVPLVASFEGSLHISVDGQVLTRWVCGGLQNGCLADIFDLASNVRARLFKSWPAPYAVLDVVAGELYAVQCDETAACSVMLGDLPGLDLRPLFETDQAAVAMLGDQPMIVSWGPPRDQPSTLHATDPMRGNVVDLFNVPPGGKVSIAAPRVAAEFSMAGSEPVTAAPPGWIIVNVFESSGRLVEYLGIPVDGGDVIGLRSPG